MSYDGGDFQRIAQELNSAETLREYAEANLERRGRDTYVCQICGSGTGPNHSAAFTLSGQGKWKCFACNNGGDVYDLCGIVTGL